VTIALITARGGSIRLPRKNILPFCGIPLIAWSILQAKGSKYISDVYVTTDDSEIADISVEYGAKVIMRPIYDNDVSAGYVLKLAVEELNKNNIYPDEIVYMLPTSPLKKVNDLDSLIASFHNINEYEIVDDLGICSPDKECYIYRNVDNMLDNYGIPYKMIPIIKDKSWNYSRTVGGWGVAKTRYLMDFWNKQGMYDSVIDSKLGAIDNVPVYGYAIEPWQCFETDYEDYFRLCELIMKEFILKGKGINAYNCSLIQNKESDVDKQFILQYSGNSKQLEEE
jgi:hypothetical protein